MTMRPRWLPSLETLVGNHACETGATQLQEHAVAGLVPSAIVWPETVAQVAAILQWAQGEKLAVVPYGSGTKIGLGAMPKRVDLVLSTRRLAQVSEYDVANFTITAEAGTTCAQLRQLTAAHMQMLPLQSPFSTATVGGIIAANAYAPKRLRYGGVRDLLLGLRMALPSGEIAHFGGKVVKNVAGYDMCKLFLGSLGALGVIVEATLKLFALPERDATLLALFPALQRGAAAVAQLMATQLLPSQILLLNAIAAHVIAPDVATPVVAGAALLMVNCEGMDEAVDRQLADIARICQGYGASTLQMRAGEAQLQLQARMEAVTCTLSAPLARSTQEGAAGALTLRLGTLPSRVPAIMDACARALEPLVSRPLIIGDCGIGSVQLSLGPEGMAMGAIDGPLFGALRELSAWVGKHGGYMVVENAAPEAKRHLDVWGTPPSSFTILKALKRKFDPEGILSPGRFIGGL